MFLTIANTLEWREVRLAFTLYIIKAFTSRVAFLARAPRSRHSLHRRFLEEKGSQRPLGPSPLKSGRDVVGQTNWPN